MRRCLIQAATKRCRQRLRFRTAKCPSAIHHVQPLLHAKGQTAILNVVRATLDKTGIQPSGWEGVRKIKTGRETADLFAALPTEPNAKVRAVHPKAMPVILTQPEEWLDPPVGCEGGTRPDR